jgi:hypothetical protein
MFVQVVRWSFFYSTGLVEEFNKNHPIQPLSSAQSKASPPEHLFPAPNNARLPHFIPKENR